MAKKQLPAKGGSKGKDGRYERTVVVGIVIAVVAIVLVTLGSAQKISVQRAKTAAASSEKTAGNRPFREEG